jgi:hypothetical protein
MKHLLLTLSCIFCCSFFLSCNSQVKDKEAESQLAESDNIEVYYFHFTRRCPTCNAVEKETQIALKDLYPDKVDAGEIVFISVNIEEADNKALAEKLMVSGQSLLVVCGKEKFDLTDDGFKYARSSPEKLHASLQTTIDPLL